MVKCKCCKEDVKSLWHLGICMRCWKKPATESTLGYPVSKPDKILKELKRKLLKSLKEQLRWMKRLKTDFNAASWSYEEGILLTGNEAKFIIKELEDE